MGEFRSEHIWVVHCFNVITAILLLVYFILLFGWREYLRKVFSFLFLLKFIEINATGESNDDDGDEGEHKIKRCTDIIIIIIITSCTWMTSWYLKKMKQN